MTHKSCEGCRFWEKIQGSTSPTFGICTGGGLVAGFTTDPTDAELLTVSTFYCAAWAPRQVQQEQTQTQPHPVGTTLIESPTCTCDKTCNATEVLDGVVYCKDCCKPTTPIESTEKPQAPKPTRT